MWWKLSRALFQRRRGAGNRRALRRLVAAGPPPGLLAYLGDEPVGWCAVEPRERYPVLDRSRTLARVDQKPVWSVTCFFVARPHRRRGVTAALLRAAVRHAAAGGARLVEGYPIAPGAAAMPDAFAWTGFAGTFARAGFREVARRSPTRAIMRYRIRRRKAR
jgi:GNAT superfamily N-acetyltransferase